MTIGPIYHAGYIVPDLDDAMTMFGEAFQLSWTRPKTSHRIVHTEEGDQHVTFHVATSLEGPPHIELIEAQPGTMWSGEEIAIHHVGVWTEDVRGSSQDLAALGFPPAAHMDSETTPDAWRIAFNHNPFGGFVELLDVGEQQGFRDRLDQA